MKRKILLLSGITLFFVQQSYCMKPQDEPQQPSVISSIAMELSQIAGRNGSASTPMLNQLCDELSRFLGEMSRQPVAAPLPQKEGATKNAMHFGGENESSEMQDFPQEQHRRELPALQKFPSDEHGRRELPVLQRFPSDEVNLPMDQNMSLGQFDPQELMLVPSIPLQLLDPLVPEQKPSESQVAIESNDSGSDSELSRLAKELSPVAPLQQIAEAKPVTAALFSKTTGKKAVDKEARKLQRCKRRIINDSDSEGLAGEMDPVMPEAKPVATAPLPKVAKEKPVAPLNKKTKVAPGKRRKMESSDSSYSESDSSDDELCDMFESDEKQCIEKHDLVDKYLKKYPKVKEDVAISIMAGCLKNKGNSEIVKMSFGKSLHKLIDEMCSDLKLQSKKSSISMSKKSNKEHFISSKDDIYLQTKYMRLGFHPNFIRELIVSMESSLMENRSLSEIKAQYPFREGSELPSVIDDLYKELKPNFGEEFSEDSVAEETPKSTAEGDSARKYKCVESDTGLEGYRKRHPFIAKERVNLASKLMIDGKNDLEISSKTKICRQDLRDLRMVVLGKTKIAPDVESREKAAVEAYASQTGAAKKSIKVIAAEHGIHFGTLSKRLNESGIGGKKTAPPLDVRKVQNEKSKQAADEIIAFKKSKIGKKITTEEREHYSVIETAKRYGINVMTLQGELRRRGECSINECKQYTPFDRDLFHFLKFGEVVSGNKSASYLKKISDAAVNKRTEISEYERQGLTEDQSICKSLNIPKGTGGRWISEFKKKSAE